MGIANPEPESLDNSSPLPQAPTRGLPLWTWRGRPRSGETDLAFLLALDRHEEVAVAWMVKLFSPYLLSVVVPGPAIDDFVLEIREGAAESVAAGMSSTGYQRAVPIECIHELQVNSLMRVDKLTQEGRPASLLDFFIDDDASDQWSWDRNHVDSGYRGVMVGGVSLRGEASVVWCFDETDWQLLALVAPTWLVRSVADAWTNRSADTIASTGGPLVLRVKAPESSLFPAPLGVFSRWIKNEPGPEGHPSLQSIAASLAGAWESSRRA